MAYVVNTTDTALQASGTSYTVTLGTHAADDILLVCVDNDSAGASISTPAGWNAFGTAAVSQATLQAWFWKKATGSGTTNPTFTVANAVTAGTALVIRGASATPADGWQRIDWGNSSTIKTAASNSVAASSAGGTTQITPTANALLIYSFSCDGTSHAMRTTTNDMIPLSKVVGSGVSHIIGYRQHGASGNPPTVTMYADTATEGGSGWVLSIADDGNGVLEKDGHTSNTTVQWYGNFGILHAGLSDEAVPLTWRALSTFSGSVGTINSIACSSTAPTVDNTVTLTSATFATGTQLTSTESTAGAWVGGYHTLTSTDMTGKLFHLTYQMNNVIGTRHGAEGMIIAFSDGTNYVAYKLCPKAAMVLNETKTLTISLGTAPTYASAGSMNWGAVTQVAYAFHRIGSSATATAFSVQNALLVDKTTIVGGHSTRSLTPAFLPSVFSGWGMYRQVDLQGSAQILGRAGIQIGDGNVVTYFDASASSTEYPVTYDGLTQALWNVSANATGITIKAGASDMIDMSSCVIATTVSQLFTIDAASSASATYSFAGTSLVGWKVTDNLGLSWTGTTFKGGDVVTIAGGGDMTNCTITDTTSTGAALSISANGSTLDGTTIDVTGTSAAYHLELGTAVTAITLTDVTFTGTPGTDKVHVLKTTGTVTITISGTTSLVAGDVTTAGATVVISAPVEYQSVTLSNYVTGSRIQVYDTTNGVELYNDIPAAAPQTLWTDSVAASVSGARDIRVRVAYVSGVTAKQFIEAAIGTVAASGSGIALSYRVNQTDDDTYNSNSVDGSAVTGITIVEGSTDRVQIAIAGGSVSWAQIYAYQCYWLFDVVGITDDGAFIEAPDTANYILTGFKIKNTHASIPLLITGGYGVDSTGSVSALYDTTGTSIFPAPAHVVPYATGSGVTPSDVTDIAAASATAAATAVWGDSKALTVPKFLGLK